MSNDKPIRRIGVFLDWTFGAYQQILVKGIVEASLHYKNTCIFFEGGALDSSQIFERNRNFIYKLASPCNVDGIIVLTALLGHFKGPARVNEFIEQFRHLPLVTVSVELPGLPSVLADNSNGFKGLLEHLIKDHGYKRLLFLTGPSSNEEAKLRLEVFKEVVKSYRLPFNEDLIVPGDFTRETAKVLAKNILKKLIGKIDVIVSANDTMALGVIEVFREEGIKIPKDIAITGLDDLDICRHSEPPLTTVRLPVYQLGFRAVEVMLDILNGLKVEPQNYIPSWPVIRESCGCSILDLEAGEATEYKSIEEHPFPDKNAIILNQLIELCKEEALPNNSKKNIKDAFEKKVLNELSRNLDFSNFQAIAGQLWNYCRHPSSLGSKINSQQMDNAFLITLLLARRLVGNEWRRIQELLNENVNIDLIRELFFAVDKEEQLNVISRRLLEIGIPTFYISFFQDPINKAEGESFCILAARDNLPIPSSKINKNYSATNLVPDDYLDSPEPKLILIQPLKEFGFILYRIFKGQGRLFAFISDIIAGALDAANLIAEVQYQKSILGKNLEQIRRAMAGFIQTMSLTIEMRDPYTAGHQRRVSDLARSIAQFLKLPAFQVESIRMAGIIHDLGKIYVPAEILNRAGPLSEIEFRLVKNHPQVAFDILKNIEFPWPLAQIIFQHHERLNGSGYPQGLSGNAICIEARILAVADVVEAMSSHRPYRGALGIDAALTEINKNIGVLYDPQVVEACTILFKEKNYQFKNYTS